MSADDSSPTLSRTDAPDWFRAAIETEAEVATTVVDGAEISFRIWGDPGGQGVVLVHGGAAHARWWDHLAPLLVAGHRRVVAIDLSGHGDSAHRPEGYSLDTWAAEVLAVSDAAGITAPPVVIGHSMGGFVTLWTATLHGSRLAGAIAVDHPVPDQPVLEYISDYVAEHSLRPVEGGFSWKFDPWIFKRGFLTPELLTRLECRVALFRGERGLLDQQMSDVMYDRLGRAAPVIEIPDAGHHVMLDQPLALITGLRTLLADWDHSRPTLGERQA